MGSYIELNDTFQITNEQWFPKELVYEKHREKAFRAEDFEGKIFEFKNKPNIRVYHMPPVRNFLVQNINGKWLYWGLIHVIETFHDTVEKTTSWKFKIIYIYTPEEMKQIDRNKETNFFNL